MINNIKKLINDFIFPVKCVSCGKHDFILCESCINNIKIIEEGFCFLCLKKRPDYSVCPTCRSNTYLNGVLVLGDYKDYVLKKLIWDLKFNFIKDSAKPLSYLLSSKFKEIGKQNFIVTSVPLHKKRLKQRGFNQSEIIAKDFAKNLDINYEDILRRDKNTESQKDLTRFERKINMDDVFRVTYDIKNKNIYLVDDVITTGATLDSCAKVLKEGGAKEVWGVVLARD
jgi:ComF family protein